MKEPSRKTGKIEIIVLKKQKNGVLAVFNDGTSLLFDDETSLNYRLYKGKEVSFYTLKKMKDENETYLKIKRFKEYLNKHRLSIYAFKMRLIEKEHYSEEEAKKICLELKKLGYFDDLSLRDEYRQYYLSRGYSHDATKDKLRDKGLFYFNEEMPFDASIEKNNLNAIITKVKHKFDRYPPLKAKQKIRIFLINKKFKQSFIDEEINKLHFSYEEDKLKTEKLVHALLKRPNCDKEHFYVWMSRRGYDKNDIMKWWEENAHD